MSFQNSSKRSKRCAPVRAPSSPQGKAKPSTVLTASLFFLPLPARSKISCTRPPLMRFSDFKIAGFAFLIFLGCAPGASLGQPKRDKSVWNYDGGVFFATDGSLPNGVCFRVSGNVTSPEFFDNLKRIDDGHGTVFRHRLETVTQFPDQLLLSFVIHDQSCSAARQQSGTRMYLTREMVVPMHLSLYWQHVVYL